MTVVAARRILLVDDNSMDIELALEAFAEIGVAGEVEVEVARTGSAAVDLLRARTSEGGEPCPSLVLLDLKMPGVDGFEVLRVAKASPGLCRMPVVIFTSSSEQADVDSAYDLGANSYLIKPVGFEGFLGLARRILGYWLDLNVRPAIPPGPEPGSP